MISATSKNLPTLSALSAHRLVPTALLHRVTQAERVGARAAGTATGVIRTLARVAGQLLSRAA